MTKQQCLCQYGIYSRAYGMDLSFCWARMCAWWQRLCAVDRSRAPSATELVFWIVCENIVTCLKAGFNQ